MQKKYFFILALFVSSIGFAQVDSLAFIKATHVFYDSSDYVPVNTQLPYGERSTSIIKVSYQNSGSTTINNLAFNLRVTHVSGPSGGIGLGIVEDDTINVGSLTPGVVDSLKIRRCLIPGVLGEFRTDYIFINRVTGAILNSSAFVFEVGDTVLAKDYNAFSKSTGPSFFVDSNLSQPGGTTTGDRIATLFEIGNDQSSSGGVVPNSVSVFIDSNSSNANISILPKIWRIEDSSLVSGEMIKNEVASSFIPITISAAAQGTWQTFMFDNGSAVVNGLSEGKYAVGIEVIGFMPGANLVLGRDTIGENLQPLNSSFVFFGHDTVWYTINDLPGIRLNLDFNINQTPRPCILVGIEEQVATSNEIIISPNPSDGLFQIELFEKIENIQVFDYKGRLILERRGNVLTEKQKINLLDKAPGIYMFKVRVTSGKVHTSKVILK